MTAAKFPAALLALVDVGGELPGFPEAALSGAHNNSVTTITLTATVPASWPTAGWVTIGSEIIQYAGKSGATLTSCTRGSQSAYGGSAAATHNDQDKVGFYLTPQVVNQIIADLIATQKWISAATPVPTIASSGTTDLSTVTSNYIQVTGTTTITAFGAVAFTRLVVLEFAGALTLTHNASSLILAGATSVTTTAGDVYAFVSEGSGNWREVFRRRASRTRSVWISSSALILRSGSPALAIRGSNTIYKAWKFDQTTIEEVLGEFILPKDAASGNVNLKIHWTNLGAGAGNVVWFIGMDTKADGGNVNTGETTAQSTIAAPGQDILKISAVAPAVAATAGNYYRFRVQRLASDAADTLANDAGLLAVEVEYTADL